jgi:hypothetical protein
METVRERDKTICVDEHNMLIQKTIKENEEMRKEIDILKKHIVNIHFKLLNLDVDCEYNDIKVDE